MPVRDLLQATAEWYRADEAFALVSVVRIFGSAPRGPGIAMAVREDGTVVGSVSGGCIEGAVYHEAMAVLESDVPRLARYGVSDDDAFAVGLTCGGDIDLFIERIDRRRNSIFLEIVERALGGQPVAAVTGIGGAVLGQHFALADDRLLTSDGEALRSVVALVEAMLRRGRTGVLETASGEFFVEVFLPPPRMLVFGATDFARALIRAAKLLGFHTTLCDARPVFATSERFPEADEIVVDQPHRCLARTKVDERTVICVLTHDPKFDIPLLRAALRTPAAYVGALGSRRTHAQRVEALRRSGIDELALARLHSPIGLDIGSATPEETAVSILAEIIAERRDASARPLRETTGPVRRDATDGGLFQGTAETRDARAGTTSR